MKDEGVDTVGITTQVSIMTPDQRLKQKRTKKVAVIFFSACIAYYSMMTLHGSLFNKTIDNTIGFASVQAQETLPEPMESEVVKLYISLDFGDTLNTIINTLLRNN